MFQHFKSHLFLWRQFDSLGCKITIEKDILRVFRKTLVLMKCEVCSLYLLKEVTIESKTYVGVDSSSDLDAKIMSCFREKVKHSSEAENNR